MKTLTYLPEIDNNRTEIYLSGFFVYNTSKNHKSEFIHVQLKPFKESFVDEIFIYYNSVVFYKNNVPIDEIKNISLDSNNEITELIESRLKILSKIY